MSNSTVRVGGGINSINGESPDSTGNIILTPPDIAAEPALGNPASNGMVLSSTTAGVRSWVSQSIAAVASVFGRTGPVLAVSGDYNATQIVNTPAGGVASTTVQAAINELDTEKASTSHAATHTNGTDQVASVTTSAAGLLPTLPNDRYKAFFGDGNWRNRNDFVALTDASTIASDFQNTDNFTVTLGGSRTLGNPSNLKAGQSGSIIITQDATGGRTLAYSSYWKFAGGSAPVLTTAANAVDVLTYEVISTTFILAAVIKDVK